MARRGDIKKCSDMAICQFCNRRFESTEKYTNTCKTCYDIAKKEVDRLIESVARYD